MITLLRVAGPALAAMALIASAPVRAITPAVGGLLAARALVLHLLWTRRLSTDLTRLLSATSIVTRA